MDREREALLRSSFAGAFVLSEKVIYQGMVSTIHLGAEASTGLLAGIKVVLKQRLDSEEELRRTQAEAALHAAIPAHPNIVRLLASEETPDAILLATTYAAQGDLWSLTKFGRAYCEREVRNCAAQMFAALHHIHAVCDVVHGDIKPHNFLLVMVDGMLVVQLCDFGLAERPATPGGLITWAGLRGTSGWFAPELIHGMDHGFPADLFGVGLILFRMLAGYAPFDPPTNYEAVDFEERYWCHVSPACRDVLLQLLAIDASARGTAMDMCRHYWISGPAPPEPTPEQLTKLCQFGPPPCQDVRFWTVGATIPPERLAFYGD